MSPKEIGRRVRNHNMVQRFLMFGLPLVSIFLWWLSFWFFRFSFYFLIMYIFRDAWTISLYLAWASMIPLLIQGIRDTRPLFDVSEFTDSDFYNGFLSGNEVDNLVGFNQYHPNSIIAMGVVTSFWATQFILCAPRTLALALKARRELLPKNETAIENASRILRKLRSTRKWVPAESCKKYGASLVILDRLHLIWTETKQGKVEIRYPAGED